MRNYILKNYVEQLTHQVIHMDQAVCYNPEYLATGKMHDYPSRKLQLAWAVDRGELEMNDFIGNLVYSYILSRQGERWQNFRENPEDCTDSFILCREMLLEKGFDAPAVKEFKACLEKNDGHAFATKAWKLPVDEKSDTYILIDDAAACGYAESEKAFASYCAKKGLSFVNEACPVFLGFEYFAYGLIEDGIRTLSSVIDAIKASKAKKVMVLSSQAKYMLTSMAEKVGIETDFEVEYLLENMAPVITDQLAYIYAGSFNVRYLCNSDIINKQVPNTVEEFDKLSIEFIPLLKADHRSNRLTFWQRPIGAEYAIFGVDQAILDSIEARAIEDIKKSTFEEIIVMEPTALAVLKKAFPDKKVVSYLETL